MIEKFMFCFWFMWKLTWSFILANSVCTVERRNRNHSIYFTCLEIYVSEIISRITTQYWNPVLVNIIVFGDLNWRPLLVSFKCENHLRRSSMALTDIVRNRWFRVACVSFFLNCRLIWLSKNEQGFERKIKPYSIKSTGVSIWQKQCSLEKLFSSWNLIFVIILKHASIRNKMFGPFSTTTKITKCSWRVSLIFPMSFTSNLVENNRTITEILHTSCKNI